MEIYVLIKYEVVANIFNENIDTLLGIFLDVILFLNMIKREFKKFFCQ